MFADAVVRGALDADQLLRRYATLVYAETGSVSETARRLGLDRRTTRLMVDPAWLAELRDGSGTSHREKPARPESNR